MEKAAWSAQVLFSGQEQLTKWALLHLKFLQEEQRYPDVNLTTVIPLPVLSRILIPSKHPDLPQSLPLCTHDPALPNQAFVGT